MMLNFDDTLIIPKNAYKHPSTLTEYNLVYDLVNGIARTPYRVNTELLNFIIKNRHLDLLLDKDVPHKFEGVVKRTKYQDSVYKSHVSKILLQENILDIATLYGQFSKFYFPVRIDMRGRLYCTPAYFHYQSNELAKALILFAVPGEIDRGDNVAIDYLKIYGANLFGGSVSKKSNALKVKWVEDNHDNIVNFDNGILLKQVKDKLLFLAFCMEYKRMTDVFASGKVQTFATYLPIQLDATCNGFQHMALLSNEVLLFKELNLTKGKDQPNDFYNFVLHKLNDKLEQHIKEGCTVDEGNKGNYERLFRVIWDRKDIKKAIMTMPYNASKRRMKGFITDNLQVLEDYKPDVIEYTSNGKQEVRWYGTTRSVDNVVNDNDITLLCNLIHDVILKDFDKIRNLCAYLKVMGTIFNKLGLPIMWSLPNGLNITQSYLSTRTHPIKPFNHQKITLNLRVTDRNKLDKNRQIRSFMPNLIHSLDAASLTLLYNKFLKISSDKLFFSIHDCFGVTASNVDNLKIMLASVYTEIYSDTIYLKNLHNHFVSILENCSYCAINKENGSVTVWYISEDGTRNTISYKLHDIDWVLGNKKVAKRDIKNINAQYLVI